MNNNGKEILGEVFPRMLEELTFIFADPEDSTLPPSVPHDAVSVDIAFSGPTNGGIQMAIGRSLGVEMASNLLGIDPRGDNATHAADDALRELMNVTCGHVLTSLAGEVPVFNLTIPNVTALPKPAWDELARDSEVAIFSVDGRPVLMKLHVEP